MNYLNVNMSSWKLEGEKDLSNKRSVWDWIKYNIRLHAISYSKEKAKRRKEKEQQLQQEYDISAKFYEHDPTDINRSRMEDNKEKLEMLYEEKVRGIIVRARARWHEHGEFRKEKSYQKAY